MTDHLKEAKIMSWAKNGMLLMAGGAIGLCLAAALDAATKNEKRDEYDDLPDGMELLVSKIRYEAEAAMEHCTTDEEREVVYDQIKDAVREIQETISDKGNEMITALQDQSRNIAAEQGQSGFEWKKYPNGDVPPIPKWMLKETAHHESPSGHVREIRKTMQNMREALDDVIIALHGSGNQSVSQT